MFKSVDEMPYNVCPKSEQAWESFVDATMNGDSYGAINAYHDYREAKAIALKKLKSKEEEYSM